MKSIIFTLLLSISFWQISIAQKCDTLRIDGVPNCYGCPVKALNIYKNIYKMVGDAIFKPLNKATINYCDNCPLQSWSNYGYENKWSNNPFSFSNDVEYNWKEEPTGVPCTEEQEPALFLGNIKSTDLFGFYANVPSIYREGQNTLFKIYQSKTDSLTEAYKKRGLNFADMNSALYKEYNTANLLLFDESTFYQNQFGFSLVFTYNKTSIELYPNDAQPSLKKTPFKLPNNITIPYIAFDNLVDVSAFENNEDMKQSNDYSKKPKIDSKLGKQYETWVQLGQNITDTKADMLRKNADYSVYNFIVVIHGISFEKNHEILNTIDWNKLYTFINTKKL